MRLITACAASVVLVVGVCAEPTAFRVQVSGKGPAMILIPGMSSSGDTWKSTVAHYQDRYTCHVVTLAGFAGVPPAQGPPLASARDQLAAYIQAQHLDKPILVGHSLGAAIAMDLAARHPALVGPLVIVDGLPFLAAAWFRVDSAEAAKPMIDAMRAYQAAQTREQYEAYVRSHASTKFMVTSTADLDLLTEWGLRSDPKTVADAMAELLGTDLRPALASIASPTLLLGTWIGLRDQLAPMQIPLTKDAVVETFTRQYASLPRLHFAISDRARHFVMFDDPAWFFDQVDAFLSDPQGATAVRGFTR